MSEQPTALVIDGDHYLLGFIADGLATFQPGFRVATCADVDAADRRIALMNPDLVVLRTDVLTGPWWPEWSQRNGIGPDRVIAIGEPPSPMLAAHTLPEPVRLSDLLAAAKEVVAGTEDQDPQLPDVPQLKAAQDLG